MSFSSKYNLQNIINYKSELEYEVPLIIDKYLNIIEEYTDHFYNNIYLHNEIYKDSIFKQGINSLSHIFNHLILNTKNLDITLFNIQKSYIYFIEFIQQICNDNNTFLQLNSKDATIFIYKKTIYDINLNYSKKFPLSTNTESKINLLFELIYLFKLILFKSINLFNFSKDYKIIFSQIKNLFFNINNNLPIIKKKINNNKKKDFINVKTQLNSELINQNNELINKCNSISNYILSKKFNDIDIFNIDNNNHKLFFEEIYNHINSI